ncbi:MAG: ATP-binding protein [Alphaproteobacteria bacterium]
MTSLRARIFVLVAAVTLVVWASATAWTYFSTRAEIQRVLDSRLIEAARMVASLSGDFEPSGTGAAPRFEQRRLDGYNRQLSCQIWSLDGRLVGRSSQAPAEPLATAGTGFSEREIEGEAWRVYSLVDQERGIRVLVGDNLSVRQRLVGDLMTGLLVPFLAAIFGLALLIWAAVGKGLVPLREIARTLRQRDPSDLRPLGLEQVSRELLPVVGAIDGLFRRLSALREKERHFIASAAHELQTPLAGLRTHAQIALMAPEQETREKSLRRIQASVDRTSRLVHQLLEFAREDAVVDAPAARWTSIAQAIDGVAEELGPRLDREGVRIQCSEAAHSAEILIDEASLALALRNLVDNALQHSPIGGVVEIDFVERGSEALLTVLDRGPGIAESEIERVRERFVRGSRAKGSGSGLGLSIVELVISRAGGRLELVNRKAGGLAASLVLPVAAVRSTAPSSHPPISFT